MIYFMCYQSIAVIILLLPHISVQSFQYRSAVKIKYLKLIKKPLLYAMFLLHRTSYVRTRLTTSVRNNM